MKRITFEIQKRKLTTLQVSGGTGIYPCDIRKLETGKSCLWPSWGKRLEAFFGISGEELMKEVPSNELQSSN